MSELHAVVMAGGSGTRFWPASRGSRPKQVLPLARGEPLIAATIARLQGLCDPEHTWIVTNERQLPALRTAVPGFPVDRLLVEPEARDTAPAIGLATAAIASVDPAATMVVMPADHVIEPAAELQRMIRRAAALAADDESLVTFGVRPTFAATGFGYLEPGDAADDDAPAAFRVRRFREKPDAATAAQFVDGGMLWNSGIFVWTCRGVRAAMAASCPELAVATDAMIAAIKAPAELAAAFRSAPRTSFDYAVMERAPGVLVVESTVRWNDVGSFTALADIGRDLGDGNRALLVTGADQIALESTDNLTFADGPRTVCLFGVEGLVVVAVDDAVMICPRSRADDLKRLVEQVQARGRTDLL
ncbi:MAG: mannose-1-phosphate guanylyltransferase [Planctomycetes bacterium]|nr:mannose-1-phosphate guanylyltransferase [Planctomycetota bacterium]